MVGSEQTALVLGDQRTVTASLPRCKPVLQPGSKIFLLGEAPGEQEELLQAPFIGQAGQELSAMLHCAGILRSDCSISNVFDIRPKDNDLKHFCLGAREQVQANKEYSDDQIWPSAGDKLYFDPAIYVPQLERIRAEIELAKPNVVVALGNIALWALVGVTGIGKLRGTTMLSKLVPGLKIFPTYHPSAVLREWKFRTVVIADLIKAKREAEYPEIRRPSRTLWLEPTVADLALFDQYIQQSTRLSIDVETKFGQIYQIGFAPSAELSLCIDLFDPWTFKSYYSAADELAVWLWIKKWCEGPQDKVGQNAIYDIQYLLSAGIRMRNFRWDTMLASHSIYTELPKDLGFLGSLYSTEPAWKVMRPRGKEAFKKDE
jgi:uracil-DNA glycosylase